MPILSYDILNITLSLLAIIITALLAILLSYLIATCRNVFHIVNKTKKQLDATWKFIEHIKDKAESAATTTASVAKAMIQVVDFVKERQAKKRKNKGEK